MQRIETAATGVLSYCEASSQLSWLHVITVDYDGSGEKIVVSTNELQVTLRIKCHLKAIIGLQNATFDRVRTLVNTRCFSNGAVIRE